MVKQINLALLGVAALLLVAAKIPNDTTFMKSVSFRNADAGYMKIASNCVTETTNSGQITHVVDDVIPARVSPLAVTCRVDTVLAGASLGTWSAGDGTDADLYGAGLAKTAGTVADSTTWTANPQGHVWSSSAADITLTGSAGVFTTGSITCCSHYVDASAPTS